MLIWLINTCLCIDSPPKTEDDAYSISQSNDRLFKSDDKTIISPQGGLIKISRLLVF